MAFSTTPSVGNDRLRTIADNQAINALAGNDWIRSIFSGSTLYGGNGHDRISLILSLLEPTETDNARSASLFGGNGNDWLVTEFTGAVVETEDFGANTFEFSVQQSGGRGNDNLYVSATADSPRQYDVGSYDIDLSGGAGDDSIWIETSGTGGWATNYVDAGSGSDIVYIYSTAGATLSSAGGSNEVDAGSGDDDVTVYSQDGGNVLRGAAGNDRLEASFYGEYGGNELFGDDGDDVLIADGVAVADGGSSLVNTVSGGGGDDTIRLEGTSLGPMTSVTNEAYGDEGNDRITSIANLGNGPDTSFGFGTTLLYGGAGDDILIATTNYDIEDAQEGGATLYGGDGDDSLRVYGGVENILNGGAGDDALTGGSGNDRIIGGSGADQLRGAGGDDAFVYLWMTGGAIATRDTIFGFQAFGDDVIDLSAIDANANRGGNQAFAFGGTGVGRVWVEDSTTGSGSIVRANNGGPETLYIAVEDGAGRDASDWSADDFLL